MTIEDKLRLFMILENNKEAREASITLPLVSTDSMEHGCMVQGDGEPEMARMYIHR